MKPIRAFAVSMIVIVVFYSCASPMKKRGLSSIDVAKSQAGILTHTIISSIQHGSKGTQDIQRSFERIGILPEIVSIRMYDEDFKVLKSAEPKEVGTTLKIVEPIMEDCRHRGSFSCNGTRDDKGKQIFCMVQLIRNEKNCRLCHCGSKTDILCIFELCIPINNN